MVTAGFCQGLHPSRCVPPCLSSVQDCPSVPPASRPQGDFISSSKVPSPLTLPSEVLGAGPSTYELWESTQSACNSAGEHTVSPQQGHFTLKPPLSPSTHTASAWTWAVGLGPRGMFCQGPSPQCDHLKLVSWQKSVFHLSRPHGASQEISLKQRAGYVLSH